MRPPTRRGRLGVAFCIALLLHLLMAWWWIPETPGEDWLRDGLPQGSGASETEAAPTAADGAAAPADHVMAVGWHESPQPAASGDASSAAMPAAAREQPAAGESEYAQRVTLPL